MCYNRIAILADLRTELIAGTCNPSRGLAELAAPLLADQTYRPLLDKIGNRSPLRAALLWSRIGDHLSGQAPMRSRWRQCSPSKAVTRASAPPTSPASTSRSAPPTPKPRP